MSRSIAAENFESFESTESEANEEDVTLTIGPEENRRLIASVFGLPDDPPSSRLQVSPHAVITMRAPPVSGVRAIVAAETHAVAQRDPRDQQWLVAGIWVMALSLLALLLFVTMT